MVRFGRHVYHTGNPTADVRPSDRGRRVRRRRMWILGGLAALGACAGLGAWAAWPQPVPVPDWAADYDLTARPPEAIPPGTVVEATAPTGWSNLVIKSLPRVRPDQRGALLGMVVDKASWMFTAFVADVVPETQGGRTRHRLRAVALGLGAKAKGRDTILTPETAKHLGADLGLLGMNTEILTKGYEIQRKAVMVVHGPSMGLLDTPVWYRCGAENRLVRYRYALLVDGATGRLDVLLWSLGAEGARCNELAEVVRLSPDTIDAAELVVDLKKVNRLGMPSDDAFAVEKLPPGPRLPFPPDLRPLASQTRYTAEEAHALETHLRKLIAD